MCLNASTCVCVCTSRVEKHIGAKISKMARLHDLYSECTITVRVYDLSRFVEGSVGR